MEKTGAAGELSANTWILAQELDERVRGHAEAIFGSPLLAAIGEGALARATVADYAWMVVAGTPEERDKIAGQLAAALEQSTVPGTQGVYYADQWTPNDDGQWWGDIYFAVSGVDRAEAELQRCAARDAANAYLETASSPYRLE
jgi:hypothetical protein